MVIYLEDKKENVMNKQTVLEKQEQVKVNYKDLKELVRIMLDNLADGPEGIFEACKLRAEELLGFNYKKPGERVCPIDAVFGEDFGDYEACNKCYVDLLCKQLKIWWYDRLRKRAGRRGYLLRKSRVKTPHLNDQGGYRVINPQKNTIILGEKYDLTLADLEKFLADA
jgi:hypothetical protein